MAEKKSKKDDKKKAPPAKEKPSVEEKASVEEKPSVEGKVPAEAVSEEVMENIPKEKEIEKEIPKEDIVMKGWTPKTSLGKEVKDKKITDIDTILDSGIVIKEAEIVDSLLPGLETELLLIGQSKGKFGGGQRRVFKQTQKKTREGNKPKFATYAIVGNKNGYVGCGYGKSKETVPAREKAFRKAKLNIIKIRRGCGSWECKCSESHSIPFQTEGSCGSVRIRLMPAPKGKGLCTEGEVAKILAFAGIKDVWSKTKGQTGTKTNLIKATMAALNNLTSTKVQTNHRADLNMVTGKIIIPEKEENDE